MNIDLIFTFRNPFFDGDLVDSQLIFKMENIIFIFN